MTTLVHSSNKMYFKGIWNTKSSFAIYTLLILITCSLANVEHLRDERPVKNYEKALNAFDKQQEIEMDHLDAKAQATQITALKCVNAEYSEQNLKINKNRKKLTRTYFQNELTEDKIDCLQKIKDGAYPLYKNGSYLQTVVLNVY
jgi:hypothetical protein